MRVGVEVGGTFTDLVAVEGGRVVVTKVPSTPKSPDIGAFAALTASGIDLAGIAVRCFDQCRVAMTLDQRQPGTGCDGGQCVAQLADATAQRGHHTAFSNLAAQHKAFAGSYAAQLLPEAQHGASGQFQPIKSLNRQAQVMHLTCD